MCCAEQRGEGNMIDMGIGWIFILFEVSYSLRDACFLSFSVLCHDLLVLSAPLLCHCSPTPVALLMLSLALSLPTALAPSLHPPCTLPISSCALVAIWQSSPALSPIPQRGQPFANKESSSFPLTHRGRFSISGQLVLMAVERAVIALKVGEFMAAVLESSNIFCNMKVTSLCSFMKRHLFLNCFSRL